MALNGAEHPLPIQAPDGAGDGEVDFSSGKRSDTTNGYYFDAKAYLVPGTYYGYIVEQLLCVRMDDRIDPPALQSPPASGPRVPSGVEGSSGALSATEIILRGQAEST